jgi:NAD+ synthase (glutamine-hydrolysing)
MIGPENGSRVQQPVRPWLRPRRGREPARAPGRPRRQRPRDDRADARKADKAGAALVVFPELGMSGYTLDDLHMQATLLTAVRDAIARVKEASRSLAPVIVVGAPLEVGPGIHGCAVVIHHGVILGVVPKTYLPNYREFYEKRQFAMAPDATVDEIALAGETVAFGTDLSFEAADIPGFTLAVDICEDVWSPLPPSTFAALAGATVIANLSASNITIGKAAERDMLCLSQSARASCGYIYSAAGYGESTTDTAWDGQLAIYELGSKIAESDRFPDGSVLLTADIDVGRISQDRLRNGTFRDTARNHKRRLNRRRIGISPPRPSATRRCRSPAMSIASPSCRTMKPCSIRIASRPTTSRFRACAAGSKPRA